MIKTKKMAPLTGAILVERYTRPGIADHSLSPSSRRPWLSTTPSICHHRSEFPKSLLCIEAGTIARLPLDLIGLDNSLEKCSAWQTDQAPARERHGRCSSRRNRCRLIHLSRNGAHYRVYVKGRPLSWRPLSCEPSTTAHPPSAASWWPSNFANAMMASSRRRLTTRR